MSGVADAVSCAKAVLVVMLKAKEAIKNKFAVDLLVGKVIFM